MLDRIKKEDEKFTETIELFENIKDSEICRIIREDSIEEFITFVNSKQISLSMAVQPSIFETNPFLIKRKPLLIEYSAFFGSIQIFKYLFDNIDKSILSPSSLWIYAIHGQNPELIQFLIDNCVLESLKCHHIEITNYLKENDLDQKVLDKDSICLNCLKNYNYIFLSNDLKDQKDIFFYLCKYDHYSLADLFLKTTKIDINAKVIFLWCFFFFFFFEYGFKLKFF